MPIIERSSYKRPWWLPSGHLQSIFPTFFRRVKGPRFSRQRIDTPDGDFIDLDLARAEPGNTKLLIISHGMEGHSRRKYVCGMANAFLNEGWDALAWNFRSCGEEMNLRPRLYYCGDTDDIQTVIRHALELGYQSVILAGFSLGASITMNYLGKCADSVPPEVLGAVVFSVPCDLTGCSVRLDQGFNRVYTWNFLRTLKEKILRKHEQMPDIYSVEGLDKISTLREFDDRYTAPIHGFSSAEDYWDKCSCLHFLDLIRRPVLLVNAENDPFLAGACYPWEEAERNQNLYLEVPKNGGHVGFVSSGGQYWSEQRAVEFAAEHFFPLAAQWP